MLQNRYTVVTIKARNEWSIEETAKQFSSKVEEMLSAGWRPLGGVSMAHDEASGNATLAQAMLKD